MTDTMQPQLQLQLETTDDEPEQQTQTRWNQTRAKPPRPSALPRKSILKPAAGLGKGSSRRRSSARFLSIGGRSARNADEDLSRESLGKMYKQAIKMNAENRINASNSWNFKLIENIDKFLTEDPEDPSKRATPQRSMQDTTPSRQEESQPSQQDLNGRRVNFTKASCTLDASVKIYSYRVDDVHLTSYRVLENLHRSDGDKQQKKTKDTVDDVDGEGGERAKASSRSKAVSTIESNVANINLNKLDAAFDIDPLFHKMSKTFDEGGAKGLLLVNLATSGNGCNIIFDSGLADDEEKDQEDDKVQQEAGSKMVDVSLLTNKLEGLLSGQPIHSISLVPQLAGLRAEFSQLEEEGFVDHKDASVSRKRRFAPDPDEEKEADKSIHQDVLERSRFSMGRSFVADDDNDAPMQPAGDDEQDYGNDFGGFDDGDDDDGFDAFIAADDEGQRYSDISFGGVMPLQSQGAEATAVLLDAIESGQVLGESDFEFFNTRELSHVAANAWAGSKHWKPVAHLHKQKVTKQPKASEKKASRSKKNKERTFVDLAQTPDLTDILRKPPKSKSRRAADPLQFSTAGITKYTKNENLLPHDAGINPTVFSSLFLRPNATVKHIMDQKVPANNTTKTVGFAMDQMETYGGADWDDGSFGGPDDDDGPGFNMADSVGGNDNDEFVVELDDVRKVEKVTVSYATIAKKVDVKRLKRDLWTEVEAKLVHEKDEESEDEEGKEDCPMTPKNNSGPLSFQQTVAAMESNKTQVDVTLPFYFICILHLANEKGLRLESNGLEDFEIHSGDAGGSFF